MPERIASLETDFRALVRMLDRQSSQHDEVHRDLLEIIRELNKSDKARDRRDQRILGALAVIIITANFLSPVVVPVLEKWLT